MYSKYANLRAAIYTLDVLSPQVPMIEIADPARQTAADIHSVIVTEV